MKISILLITFFLSYNLHAGFVCNMAKKGIEVATEVVAMNLKCEREEAIHEDLAKLIKLEEICVEDMIQSTTSPVMCSVIAKSASSFIVTKIPEGWECDERVSRKRLDKIIYTACTTLIE